MQKYGIFSMNVDDFWDHCYDINIVITFFFFQDILDKKPDQFNEYFEEVCHEFSQKL